MSAENSSISRELDSLCDEYEQQLRTAVVPDDVRGALAEKFLQRVASASRAQLLQLLMEMEFEYRLMRNLPTGYEEYQQRFPEYIDELSTALKVARERVAVAGTRKMPAGSGGGLSGIEAARAAVQSAVQVGVQSAVAAAADVASPPPAVAALPPASEPAAVWCMISGDGVIVPTDRRWDAEIERDFGVGTLLQGRYLVTDLLGRGGMGCVLLARDQLLHRDVAVKVLLRRPALRAGQPQESLEREARLAASLNHRGIAMVHDFGHHGGRCFTVFEYVRGRTLRSVLHECRKLSWDVVRAIVVELADALDAAHAAGVVHQDLKPENICTTLDGQPKILDFGVARELGGEAERRGFFGTPNYSSPEQAACSATDGRADQYALALLAFEMLSGQRVFQSGSELELLRRHREDPPPRLEGVCAGVPAETSDAIAKALAKSPASRFATCREFAQAAFGAASPVSAASRTLVAVPEAEQLDVFLCHVALNSLYIRQLAETLQQHGLKTWYYQRDALPGVSFLRQTTDAIERSRVVVLLISPASLAADEFGLQVRAATERRRPLLPLLQGISAEEFELRQPSWRALLAPAALTDVTGIEKSTGFLRVLQRLEQVGLEPESPRRWNRRGGAAVAESPRTAGLSAVQSQIWATDSSQIDVDDLPQLVFQNDLVEEFLSRRNRYFLSGTKGLGKTLLLSFKRQLIARRAAEGDGGAGSICFIPHSGSRLDLMHEMRTVSTNYETSLAELSVTKRFWSVALRISAISHHPGCISDEEKFEVETFPQRFRRWLRGAEVAPSVVFKELTNLSVGHANSLVDNTETFLDEKLRSIHSPTCFFVDKVDQAVRERSRDAWIHIQAGLIEAAWEIMNSNSHIRVYASIRQEAFSNYHSDVKSNLLGATVRLRYSDAELEHMMNRLTSCYESSRDFRDFVGLRVLQHPGRSAPEDAFRFLRRHTFGRPRDLVVIAAELSGYRGRLSEAKYCEVVRTVSASNLVTGVFEEMRVFMDCLGDPDNRDRFIRCLTANILSRSDAVTLCARFNGVTEAVVRDFGEDSVEIFHPFQDLYLAGLLGIVVVQSETEQAIQRFRRPDDLVSIDGTDLPNSPWYFIHPALSAYIRQQAWGSSFVHYEQAAVGDGLPWNSWDPICCEVERQSRLLAEPELRQFTFQVLRQAREVLGSGTSRSLQVLLQALPDWKSSLQRLQQAGHEELVLWLEELAVCKR